MRKHMCHHFMLRESDKGQHCGIQLLQSNDI